MEEAVVVALHTFLCSPRGSFFIGIDGVIADVVRVVMK